MNEQGDAGQWNLPFRRDLFKVRHTVNAEANEQRCRRDGREELPRAL